jgi:hypothetical protein
MNQSLIAVAVATFVVAAPASAMRLTHVAPKKITRDGVGQVKLGMTFQELREKGLVGRLRAGCELGGPNTRSARLRSPLRGTVDFTRTMPRKARTITILRGARARGVKVGDRIRDIKDAYPKAKVDRSTEEVFGVWLVRVPRDGGGRIMFSVRVDTKRIDRIGVPVTPFCE